MSALLDFAYTVRVSPRARRCRVQVGRDGVTLVVPHRMRLDHAKRFLREQADWVRHHLARRADVDTRLPAGQILYRGAPVPVAVSELAITRPRVHRVEAGLAVYVPMGRTSSAPRALVAFLRREAVAGLTAELDREAAQTALMPTSVSFRDQRSRWGSCSRRGHIALNWRLWLAPPAVSAYVIVHELAHLEEPNHGPRFWRLVERHCPDFRVHRDWLKRNGDLLHRAGR